MAAHTDRWYFSREQLQNTPSRKCGVEPEKELSYRQQSANLIQDMGQRLQVNQLCINTAIVYMHRFYMFQSFTRFLRNSIAAACLFLAAKVEEQPHKLEHVLKVAHLCLHRGAPALDTKSDIYMQQSQELVINESIILQTFASKVLAQTSYFMATNSLHLTTFCLQYKPTLVACVCVHLACKWSQYEIPKSNDDNYWWEYVDSTVTKDLLDRLIVEFLQIIEACPNRLKRRITIHKEQALASKKRQKEEGGEEGCSTKPGSQSSIDSGFADMHERLQVPSDMGSPWLTNKPTKEGENPEAGESSDLLTEPNLPEQPQPTKKSYAEYKLQKEKEQRMKEQRAKEEKMKQEKAKIEKRMAYEAQLLKADSKIRPKPDPQHQPKPRPQDGTGRPHAGGERPPPGGERPSSHQAIKGKAEHSGDPHIKHSKELPKSRPVHPSQGGEGHRPDGTHVRGPPLNHHKRPNPNMSKPPPGKETRHHYSQEHPKSQHLSVKLERTDEARMAQAKSRGSHRPRPEAVMKPHGPIYQPKTPPLPEETMEVEPGLPMPKHHQLPQSQRDEDQRVNDELSDLRDEIMKDLEKDASSSDLGMRMGAQPIPAAAGVVKKRNSLDNLRQVAQQELVHIKKSGTENRPQSLPAGGVVKETTSRNDLKKNVKLKTGEDGTTQQQASLQSPPKKSKSPGKKGRETPKGTKNSNSLATSKSISPVQKRKASELVEKSQSSYQHPKSDTSGVPHKSNGRPPKEPKTDGEGPSLKHKSTPTVTSKLPEKSSTVKIKSEKQVKVEARPVIKEEKMSRGNAQEKARMSVLNTASKSDNEPQSVNIIPEKKMKVKAEKLVDSVEASTERTPPTPNSRKSNFAESSATKTIQSVKTEKKSPSAVPIPEVSKPSYDLNSGIPLSLQGVDSEEQQRESPKHKHRHKDKKKHKKHRQEKPAERSASPSVESTSILTTSGGIKLKIKGLSLNSSSSPVNPAAVGKSAPTQDADSLDGAGGSSLKLKLNASSPGMSEKEHKHRHKHKSRADRKDGNSSKKRQTSSPGSSEDQVPTKKRALSDADGKMPQASHSLLSLPMPPPDPKKSSSPAKHSKHKSRKHHNVPPPPPPPRPGSPESPPPPPPPRQKLPSLSQLETVTALPPMEMDPNAFGSQYLMYPGAVPQGNSVSTGHKLKKPSHHHT